MRNMGSYGRSAARAISLVVFFLMLSVLLPQSNTCAESAMIYVDANNSSEPWDGTAENPYKSITDGITAAASDDTVYVKSGTYNEHVIITKNLTLTGENKDSTTINGGSTDHVIYVSGSSMNQIQVYISGFTIQNAGGIRYHNIAFSYATKGEITNNKIISDDQSGGIQLDHCQEITIQNNIISNKVAGISLILSENNVIQNNILEDNQKGIHLSSYSNNNQIRGNTIRSNSEFGVYVSQSSANVFSLNDFTGNSQNAQDSFTNAWSANSKGNYWDDYNNYDSNGDGIGDVPYTIPGGGNTDPYPLGYFKGHDQPSGENQPPTARLPSISPNPAMLGETIYFSGDGVDTDGYITGYSWQSTPSGVQSTQKSFTSSNLPVGSYTISFKVQDNDGAWSDEKTVVLTVTQSRNKIPVAVIDSITPNPVEYGKSVHFSGYGIDQDGSIIAWKWTSSLDGDIGTQASFATISLSAGTHTISFQVQDNDNTWSNKTTQELVVFPLSSADPSANPPVAEAGGPYAGSTDNDITFNGSGSYQTNGTITTYRWTYGDEFSGTGMSASHRYSSPGIYTVTLRVTGDDGRTATDTATVSISEHQPGTTANGNLLPEINLFSPFLLIGGGLGIAAVVILGFISRLKKMR